MLARFRFLPLLLMLLAAASSCSKKSADEQATAAATDGDEIDPFSNVVFTFSEPVISQAELDQNRWDTTQYVRFVPAVRGKYMWTGTRELTFSPLEPFRPSTVFQASLRPQTLPADKQQLTIDRTHFHTPYLQLGTAQLFFAPSPRAVGTAELRASLPFNYPVRPADLAGRVRVTQSGQPVAMELASTETGREVTLRFPQDVRPGAPLNIEVTPGLRPVAGGRPTVAALTAQAVVPEQQALDVRELTGSLLDGEPVVTVLTTQPVTVEAVTAALQVSPSVPFSVQTLESGFSLRGGFEVGKTYQVTLASGLAGTLGGLLGQPFSQGVSFDAGQQPSLSFASAEKALYLSAIGNRNLGLRLNDVKRVKVTIAKVYANNVQQLLRAEQTYGYGGEEEEGEGDGMGEGEEDEYGGGHSYRYYDLENLGDVISERTVSVDALTRDGSLRLLNLNLKELEFSAPLKGLYVVRVQDTKRQWLRADKLLALTDIGLIVKRGAAGKTLVFANSIRTAQPLAGVTVRFLSSNQQVMGSSTTSAGGVAEFDSSAATSRFKMSMITGLKGDDFSFLDLGRSRVETSRFDVGGLVSNAARYQAFLYGDRDLYRPGDTIRTNTVVRTESWQKPPAGLPMKIRLLLPTGREYASLRGQLSAAGSFESRFILPPSVQTGLYQLEVLTGNDVLLTSKQLSVEEFIPDRLKVTVEASPRLVQPGQTVTASLTALNLFGPPAADRKFEVEFSLKPKPFAPKGYGDFSFELSSGERHVSEDGESSAGLNTQFENTTREGETDAAGQGAATYEVPDYHDLGTLEGTAFATVFDETGRPVNRLATYEVQTQATMFGLGRLPDLVSTRQAVAVRMLALTPAGRPTQAPAQVKVVRLLWETLLERAGGSFRYNSQRREQVVLDQQKTVGAGSKLSFTPLYSGEYEVRVSRPGAATYVAQRFYAYGYGDTQSNSFEVSNEGEVTIEADKPKYAPGETATLLLKTPFPGRVLVTVERNRVLEHFYVNTDQKSARVKVDIKAEYLPNVYVTATAIRSITDNRLPLTVARGFVPLTVARPEARLPVRIAAAAQSRSQTWQTIEVSTAPHAQVTLAMVDEGILQLKNYQTPDPYTYFYQKRALEVSSFDVYPFLLPELGRSSSGGDGSDLSRRTTPVPNRRVKLLARWSGVLTADASGKVRYRLHLPQFSGAVRVMAVAYKDDAFGSAEHTMKVADPVVISTALPRFMSPGDTIDVPVTLTNTTGKLMDVVANIEYNTLLTQPATGNYTNPDSKQKFALKPQGATALLKPNSEGRVFYRLLANSIGEGRVKIVAYGYPRKDPAVAGNNTDKDAAHPAYTISETIDLPVRPAAPLEKRTGSGALTAGASLPLNLKTDFLPSSLRSQLVLSRSPMAEFSKDLRYLLQYPYGCLEQTVSAAFPQLYYGDLAATLQQKTGAAAKAQRYNPNYHVQEAIRKIEAMQLYNGSLSYWPGGDYDNWWATAYAAHFLQEAQRAGFAVNKTVLDKVLRYLEYRLKKRETEEYHYFDANNLAHEKIIAKKEIAYSLYVLALAGRPDPVALNYYRANRAQMALDSRFLLACTQGLSGNQRVFQQLLPARFGGETAAGRALDGSFYSPLRDQALVLNALLDVDPNNPQVPALARQLSQQLRTSKWYNTQERAFALLALGKIARRNARSNATAALLAEGKTLARFLGPDLTVNNVANRPLSLRSSGRGQLYYFWETEGISAGGQVHEEDSYLKVRRQFLTRTGAPVGTPSFRQNDLVVVRLTIQAGDAAGTVPNVAITDLLPAGLEIENPRIGAVRELDWAKDAATPDYLDVRDDRINLFTTAEAKPKAFYYLARAVSKGTFKLGPVSADAMYNAEYHSYNGAGTVRVR